MADLKHACNIDAEHMRPILRGDITEQLLLCDSGVIDQHVDAAKAIQYLRRHPGGLRFIREIGAKERRITTSSGQLVQKRTRRYLILAVAGRDAIAFPRENLGACSANSARRASYQYSLRHERPP